LNNLKNKKGNLHVQSLKNYPMKQVVFYETGLPEKVLQLEEIEKPKPAAKEALIRITARAVLVLRQRGLWSNRRLFHQELA
jgi:hypothetical protein